MNGVTKCLAAVFLMSVFSVAAQGAPSKVGTCDDCKVNGWGPKVVFTCAVMGDLTFKDLYDGTASLQLGVIAAAWKENSKGLVPPNGSAQEFSAALDELAKAAGSLTARELFTKKHDDLPKGVVKAVQDMKKAGLMALTCADRPNGADKELTNTMSDLVANPKFKTLTFHGLYSTPATLEAFDDNDLALIIKAMDSVKLLRDEVPDKAETLAKTGANGGLKAVGCCSRATRQCVLTASGNCTMCSGSCCLGSSWCS